MKEEYKKYIKQQVAANTTGRCKEYCIQMLQEFPELHLVRGHHDDPIWGLREHWWLMTKTGEIIDPTANQFPGKGIGEYHVWDEGAPEPTGMCPHCGEYTWENEYIHEHCREAFLKSLA